VDYVHSRAKTTYRLSLLIDSQCTGFTFVPPSKGVNAMNNLKSLCFASLVAIGVLSMSACTTGTGALTGGVVGGAVGGVPGAVGGAVIGGVVGHENQKK
jgi:hypothetical protein